jgi:pimeloyl-ACP methyl ester carboxylesterase
MPNIQINSEDCFFRTQGTYSARKPAVLLLHGSGGDSSVWHDQLDGLSNERHVIAPDLPGHGQSRGTAAHTPEAYASWLALLTEALQLQRFILAGHSLGGIIAQQFARMFPEKLQGLILIGTGMRFEIQQEYLDMLGHDFHTACMISCRQAYAAPTPPAMLAKGLNMLRLNGPETLERDLRLCAQFDSTSWAHTLTMPCLILCGTDDAITPCSLSQGLSGAISNSILKCFDAAGHMVMQEQPRQFNREVSLFITTYCLSDEKAR